MGMRFMNIALFWLYFICRKGDYYRYLAEFSSGAERKEAADQSLEAYKVLVIIFCLVLLYSCIHVNNIFFFLVNGNVGCCCGCGDWIGTNTSS